LILLLFFISMAASAQDIVNEPSSFHLIAEGGGGYSYRLSAAKLPLADEQRSGPAFSFRLKWGAGRVVSVGVETGWISVSSMETKLATQEFGPVNISSSLSAVPVIGFISLRRTGVEVSAGLGYYYVSSVSTVMGSDMESSEWDLGYLLSLGYTVPLTADWNIIGTLRWNNIAEQQITSASFQAQIQYQIY
jgi:hypothetical protein